MICDYIEMRLADFVNQFPDEWAMLLKRFPVMEQIDVEDLEYIVRMSPRGLEIGYASDKFSTK